MHAAQDVQEDHYRQAGREVSEEAGEANRQLAQDDFRVSEAGCQHETESPAIEFAGDREVPDVARPRTNMA